MFVSIQNNMYYMSLFAEFHKVSLTLAHIVIGQARQGCSNFSFADF